MGMRVNVVVADAEDAAAIIESEKPAGEWKGFEAHGLDQAKFAMLHALLSGELFDGILTPDPATAYRLALVCQRVCLDPAWLDRANRTVAAIEATLDTATRLRQFEAAQALLLGAFAHPVEDPPVTPGYWWNAR